jgi:hypothetical protein
MDDRDKTCENGIVIEDVGRCSMWTMWTVAHGQRLLTITNREWRITDIYCACLYRWDSTPISPWPSLTVNGR